MYKQSIKSIIASNPKANNVDIAEKIGIHRNTVAKLLGEISIENEKWVNERWKMLLNDVTEIGFKKSEELDLLFMNSYRQLYHSKPAQLAQVSKTNWSIIKDLYKMHLEYMGIRQAPKSLIQVNITR